MRPRIGLQEVSLVSQPSSAELGHALDLTTSRGRVFISGSANSEETTVSNLLLASEDGKSIRYLFGGKAGTPVPSAGVLTSRTLSGGLPGFVPVRRVC